MRKFDAVWAAALLAVQTACTSPTPLASSASPPAGAAAARHAPKTTDGRIAVRNLSSQIESNEGALKRDPSRRSSLTDLVSLYQTRAQFLGRIADYESMEQMAERRVKAAADAEGFLVRAGARASLHEFAGALADVTDARKRKADPEKVEALEASILQATGRTNDALVQRRLLVKDHPDISTIGSLATLLGDLGRTGEADALFSEALDSYRDVSAFPVAWVSFQRGRMWEKSGEIFKAQAEYEEAISRLPAYAEPRGHLAAILFAAGHRAEAVELLRGVVHDSDDPQYQGQLATLLGRLGSTQEADALRTKAVAAFEDLLKRHPAAFQDHAARFWLDAGSPMRAFQLANANLSVRQTGEAYELALQAAVAAQEGPEACQVAGKALVAFPEASRVRDLATWTQKKYACSPEQSSDVTLPARVGQR
jgi:tetratricopeptide (TPR) repeat protein